jgi:hypothetical protein
MMFLREEVPRESDARGAAYLFQKRETGYNNNNDNEC